MEAIFRKHTNGKLEVVEFGDDENILEKVSAMISATSVEAIKIRTDIFAICDEELFMKDGEANYKTNFWHDGYYDKSGKKLNKVVPKWIYGNVVFVGLKGKNFVGLDEEQKEFVKNYLY